MLTDACVMDPPRTARRRRPNATPLVAATLAAVKPAAAKPREDLEACLHRLQKIEIIARLTSGVVHDFNNQLTIIVGYCDLLLSDTSNAERNKQFLETIRGAAMRSAALTSRLLAIGRKQGHKPEDADLNGIIQGLADLLTRLLGEDIQLTVKPAPDLGEARLDPALLEHAVMNLAINARDAMPQGGRLLLETRNVDLDAAYVAAHPGAALGPHVSLSVTDTGTGIDEATLQRVFEPFFTTKPEGCGTGLGLPMVQDFVKQSCGHLTVQSQVGCGTTFTLYFSRLRKVAREADETEDVRPLPVGTETVLVAEDDGSVRQFLVQTLTGLGYRVLAGKNGDAVLALGRRHGSFGLLITDTLMPGMSGPDLAAHLRSSRPQMPVLYVTGCTNDVLVRQGVAETEGALLRKPFTPRVLAEAVRGVLDGCSSGDCTTSCLA